MNKEENVVHNAEYKGIDSGQKIMIHKTKIDNEYCMIDNENEIDNR